MKAAILVEQNKPLEIWELEIPDMLKYGQVLVDVKYAGICGAQVNEITGAAGPDKYLPHLLGHEGAGIVERIGPGVTHVKEGDRVVMHWRKGIGIDAQTPTYRSNYRGNVGAGPIATFAEQAVVSENRLTPITQDMPFGLMALLGCGVTTGLGIINNEAQVKMGQSIVVAGCGGVGLNVIQGAAMVSAHPIIGIDVVDLRLVKAKEFGANVVCKATEAETIIDTLFLSNGVDVFVDCTGQTGVIDMGYRMLAPGGKLILVGQPKAGQDLTLTNMRTNYKGKTLMDSQGGLTDPTRDIPRYASLAAAGKLKLSELIAGTYPLENINEAFQALEKGAPGRIMLECGND